MERECRDDIVAAGHDPSAEWVLVLSRRRSDGDFTIVRRDDRRVSVECRIRDGFLPREVSAPIASDDPGILQQCGAVAGYDFTGWSVVTSMAAVSGVEAVLASTNGCTAYCSLQPKGWDSGRHQRVTMPEASDRRIGRQQSGESYRFPGDAGFSGSSLSIKTAHTPIEGQLWHGSGTLYDGRGEVAESQIEVPMFAAVMVLCSIGLLVHQLLYENVRVRSVSDDTLSRLDSAERLGYQQRTLGQPV